MSGSTSCVRSFPLFTIATLALMLLALGSLFGQQPGAIPQFSTVETHEYDTINLGTLGIQLNVPIRSKAGHIPYSYRLNGASQISLFIGNGSDPGFIPSPWLIGGEAHVPQTFSITSSGACPNNGGVYWNGFAVTDALGNSHSFTFQVGSTGCGGPVGGAYALDNSGLYLHINWNNGSPITTLYDISGNWSTTPFTSMTDPNGNTISATTDTLGQTAMTFGSGTYTWTDALNNPQSVTVSGSGSSYKTHTAFGCTYDAPESSGSSPIITSISFPDGSKMSLTHELGQYDPTAFTGRIASITLPTGGTISYAYSGGTNGINCIDGTPATVKRTTPDGTWTYTHVAPSTYSEGLGVATTTVQDPQGNNTVYTFNVGDTFGPTGTYGVTVEAEKQVYNGSAVPANLLETVITCYNTPNSSPTNCPGAAALGFTEKDVYTTYPGVTGYSAVKTSYDSYGRVSEVKAYDFGLILVSDKQIQYGTGNPTSQTCSAISNSAPGLYIIDKPCSVTLKDANGNILTQTWNSYDGNGNLLQTWNLVSGSGASGTYISKSYTYVITDNGTPAETNGVVQAMTDVNRQVMNYTATSCNNMFVTSQYPTNFSNLQTSQTWDCNGGVVTSATDANGETTKTNFYVGTTTDPFYRPLQDVDELGNITSFTYGYTSALLGTTDSQFLFNSNASVIETLSTTDSIGRPAISQLRQGPSSANWETKSRTFDSDGRTYETSLTCVGAASTACSASTESQTYDGLNRPLVHTGTGGDIVTKTYPANDVLTKLTPAPANENAKQVQKEYDGLGRLKSVCVISSAAGSASCNQTTAATGFLTTYTYDGAGRLLQTIENAQVSSPNQTRKYTYDLLGRVTSETNPEWAATSGSLTAYYTYDSVTGSPFCPIPTGMTLGSNGDLVQKVDPNGNTSCYFYDGLHRNIAITYFGPNSNGVNKFFVYDSATVNGTAMTYAEGRLAEAYTCSGATLPCSSKITDEGFSYDQRGLMSAYYQMSPNSGGYYTMSATRWEDKQLKTVSGVGLPTLTYGTLDGEGRVQTVNASSGLNPVKGVTYNSGPGPDDSIGSVLTTTLGAGDTQNFIYDKNTARITSYSASVGATPTVIAGSLNWNANGTLKQLSISDAYNSADTQVCSYLYDDFVRLAGTTGSNPIAGVNCVNGSTKVWNETYTYGSDSFGNLTKTTTGPGTSWACTTCYNTATNQYNSALSASIAYDSNGNLLNDTFHTYTWLADGHVATIDSNTITYDANGNKVEEKVGGAIREYVSAFGVDAQMQGSSQHPTNVSLPGGVQAVYSAGSLYRFRYPDWQGTIRAESEPGNRVFSESLAFAPFGERYAQKGTPINVDSFTGKPDQIVSDEYDFPAREEHGGQGRWVSPDPMRGTGNKYVYADNNPLSKVDLYGLIAYQEQMDPAMQAWFESEENRPDPLLESHAPWSGQTGGSVFGLGENAYLAQVDFAFESISTDDPPRLQLAQAVQSQTQGQPAQEAQNHDNAANLRLVPVADSGNDEQPIRVIAYALETTQGEEPKDNWYITEHQTAEGLAPNHESTSSVPNYFIDAVGGREAFQSTQTFFI